VKSEVAASCLSPLPSRTGWFTRLNSLTLRHVQALSYLFKVVLPVILTTGKRPVIFSRYAGMGDIICSIPTALELKKRHPGATFIYNCHASSACIPGMGGLTEQITSCEQIGLVGYWYRWALAGFYSFGSDDDDLTADHSELFLVGYARRNGVTVKAEHPRLQVDSALVGKVKALRDKCGLANGPLILIHPGPSYPVKHWPRESWAALTRELQQETAGSLAQLGARVGSYAQVEAEQFQSIPGVVSLVGQLSLPETIALIAQADLFVGLDSGLLHIAASVGTPAVGLWGPTAHRFLYAESESRYSVTSRVECQGCHHRMPRLHWQTGCPYDAKCMKAIPVDEVLQACRAALASKTK
jgi:ADP-heptose:LPS heptosyltransferase